MERKSDEDLWSLVDRDAAELAEYLEAHPEDRVRVESVRAGIAAVVASRAPLAIKASIAAALADPSVLEGTIEGGPMNGMPKHAGMGLATADVLLHSWDLGQAIGVNVELPTAAVEAVQMGLSQVPEEMLLSPGMFGPAIAVPDDASAQDKLLGFTGRQP